MSNILFVRRSHDVKIGKQFYSRLKALRDALGLQFRFEVIFDDGSHLLTVADHFMERLTKWGATCTTHPSHTTTTTSAATSTTTTGCGSSSASAVSAANTTPAAQHHHSHTHMQAAGGGGCGASTGGGGGVNQNGGLLEGCGDAGGGSHIHSYKELEHLPCVVVLAGSLRAGLSFPR